MKRTALFALPFVALALCAAPAAADPLLPQHSLSPAVERTLVADVRASRAAHPELFRRVQHLQGLTPAVYNATRLQRPSVSRELMALGPDALLPMLDTLVLSGYPTSLDVDQREALEQGLLQAISVLHDPRAEPGLRAAFTGMTSTDSVRAAARGLGALCTDSVVTYLTTEARTASPRRDAALEGLGACRRPSSVRVLADALDHAADDRATLAAAHGLANAGSSWAQTARPSGEDLSQIAAQSLVRAYARASAATRSELQIALMSVGYQGSLQLVRDAASHATDAAQRQSLTTLENALRHAGITR